MIIDEVDAIFGKKTAEQHEDLRALINAGHQRGRPVLRCFGPNHQVAMFDTFAMAVLAGIGVLPDTVTDRAVNIHMRRRASGETVSQFRSRRDGPILTALRDRLAAWAAPLIEELKTAEPDMPVEDRAADTWEPLIAMADIAGGDWPDQAWEACIAMVASDADADENQSLGILLLADIRDIFADQARPFVSTGVLVEALRAVESSPWKDFDFNARKLAYRLAPFGVKPKPDAKGNVRGYRLEDLKDAFTRYLRQNPSNPSETTSEQAQSSDGSESSDGSTRQTGFTRQKETADQTPFLTGLTGSDGPRGGNGPPTAEPSGDGQRRDSSQSPCHVCGNPIPSKEMVVVRGQCVHHRCRTKLTSSPQPAPENNEMKEG